MKTIKTFILSFFIACSTFNVFSQSNDEDIPIPLEEIEDNERSENLKWKRNNDLFSILPTIYYNTVNNNLYIISPFFTFENLTYYIINENGITLQTNELTLTKEYKTTIPLTLPMNGLYIVVIKIEDKYFQGVFNTTTAQSLN